MKKELRIIPLGGLGEVGKNMMVMEYGDDIIAIDCGLMFPHEDMLGIDLVIPDITYLQDKKERIKGIIITHGHEDHIGALPFILPQLEVPVYATRLTHGLISVKLREHRVAYQDLLKVIEAGEEVSLGNFRIETFRVSHSIPDSIGLAIHTPLGLVVHSGDFKFDNTPVDGKQTDFAKLAEFGDRGTMLLLSDSTYAELQGYTASEKLVGETLDNIIASAPGRVILATFASLISRAQQVIDAAAKYNKRVLIIGKSMVDNVRMAVELGYLNIPPGTQARLDELRNITPDKLVILTTGSQGEPTSVLAKLANREHPHLKIGKGDTVIISATPIPGKESIVNHTIDNLFRQGANVLYDRLATVHVHGHGSQEELKMLLSLVKPKYFIPIHGQYRQLYLHSKLAMSSGIMQENIFVMEDGDVLQIDNQGAHVSEKVVCGDILVDGLSVGDSGGIVLRERKSLSQSGIVVVILPLDRISRKLISTPWVVSRGFIESTDSSDILDRCQEMVINAINHNKTTEECGIIQESIKEVLAEFLYEQTHRRPMVVPVVMEI